MPFWTYARVCVCVSKQGDPPPKREATPPQKKKQGPPPPRRKNKKQKTVPPLVFTGGFFRCHSDDAGAGARADGAPGAELRGHTLGGSGAAAWLSFRRLGGPPRWLPATRFVFFLGEGWCCGGVWLFGGFSEFSGGVPNCLFRILKTH